MRNDKAFVSLEILYSLFILSLTSFLLISSLKGNLININKNKSRSDLNRELESLVSSINNGDKSGYLNELKNKKEIFVEEELYKYKVKKHIIDEKLWELEISVYEMEGKNKLNWVIVVESPKE